MYLVFIGVGEFVYIDVFIVNNCNSSFGVCEDVFDIGESESKDEKFDNFNCLGRFGESLEQGQYGIRGFVKSESGNVVIYFCVYKCLGLCLKYCIIGIVIVMLNR